MTCRSAVQRLSSQAGFASDFSRSGQSGWGGRVLSQKSLGANHLKNLTKSGNTVRCVAPQCCSLQGRQLDALKAETSPTSNAAGDFASDGFMTSHWAFSHNPGIAQGSEGRRSGNEKDGPPTNLDAG